MPEILSILRDIVLMRRGPQDLPYSPAALVCVAVLGVIVTGLTASSVGEAFEIAVIQNSVATALNLGLLYLVLLSQQRQQRFNQTALATLLIAAAFGLIALIVVGMSGPLPGVNAPLPAPNASPEAITGGLMFALLVLLIAGLWSLVIEVHILRNAVETRFVTALLLLLSMRFAVAVFVVAVFGKSVEGT